MPTKIEFENRFGEQQFGGLLITTCEDEDLYEILGILSSICNNHADLCQLEKACNIDKREGYTIHPLTDEAGNYVWYWQERNLVLCLARGIWG